MKYINLSSAILLHDAIIEHSGGLSGLKDEGQLDSVLTHIQNDDYYPSFTEKLTHLVFSLVKFHVFMDGNKRTAIILGVQLMSSNQYGYACDKFISKMETIVVQVAENKIDKIGLQKLITSILYGQA